MSRRDGGSPYGRVALLRDRNGRSPSLGSRKDTNIDSSGRNTIRAFTRPVSSSYHGNGSIFPLFASHRSGRPVPLNETTPSNAFVFPFTMK